MIQSSIATIMLHIYHELKEQMFILLLIYLYVVCTLAGLGLTPSSGIQHQAPGSMMQVYLFWVIDCRASATWACFSDGRSPECKRACPIMKEHFKPLLVYCMPIFQLPKSGTWLAKPKSRAEKMCFTHHEAMASV